MLSFLAYRTLSDEAKTAYVFAHGTYLANRCSQGYSVWLYHLGSFFCEAWVCQWGELRRLVCFTSSQGLLPYAALVHLPPYVY